MARIEIGRLNMLFKWVKSIHVDKITIIRLFHCVNRHLEIFQIMHKKLSSLKIKKVVRFLRKLLKLVVGIGC